MAKFTVRTQLEGFTGESAGVAFVDGVAEVDGEEHYAALLYFQGAGYSVEKKTTSRSKSTAAKATEDKGD
jgi:hypothetical protein